MCWALGQRKPAVGRCATKLNAVLSVDGVCTFVIRPTMTLKKTKEVRKTAAHTRSHAHARTVQRHARLARFVVLRLCFVRSLLPHQAVMTKSSLLYMLSCARSKNKRKRRRSSERPNHSLPSLLSCARGLSPASVCCLRLLLALPPSSLVIITPAPLLPPLLVKPPPACCCRCCRRPPSPLQRQRAGCWRRPWSTSLQRPPPRARAETRSCP